MVNYKKVDLLTNSQLSEELSITTRTLQNYRDKGLIEFIKIGRKIYYQKEAVFSFLESFKNVAWNNSCLKGGVYVQN